MTEQLPTNAQKRKRPLPPWVRGLMVLLIPIFLAVACYGGLWVFARYGGELVMETRLSPPAGSRLMSVSYREERYVTYKVHLYFHPVTPEAFKIYWATFHRNDLYDKQYISAPLAYHIYSSVVNLFYPRIPRIAPSNGECGNNTIGVGHYSRIEDFHGWYPDLKLPDNTIPLLLYTCWPNFKSADY